MLDAVLLLVIKPLIEFDAVLAHVKAAAITKSPKSSVLPRVEVVINCIKLCLPPPLGFVPPAVTPRVGDENHCPVDVFVVISPKSTELPVD